MPEYTLDLTSPFESSIDNYNINRLLFFKESSPGLVKITKSRGVKKVSPSLVENRNNNKGTLLPNGDVIHLANYSLIKFPNENKFYVVENFLGNGINGTVKIMPTYYEKNTLTHNYVKKILPPEEKLVLKVSRQINSAYGNTLASKEVFFAQKAGGDNKAMLGGTLEKKSQQSSIFKSYIKLSYIPGTNLAKLLQSDINITLRLKIINDIIIQLNKINANGYAYIDIRPENILYDATKNPCVNFIDWASCAPNDANKKTISELGSLLSNRCAVDGITSHTYEAHQLAGLIGIILSSNNLYPHYTDLPIFFARREAYEHAKTDKSMHRSVSYPNGYTSLELLEAGENYIKNAPFLLDRLNDISGISTPTEKALLSHIIRELKKLSHSSLKLVPNNYSALANRVSALMDHIARNTDAPGILLRR